MPRKKKVEVENQLEATTVEAVPSILDMEADDFVTGELSEESALASKEMLKEMDEKTRINASKRAKKSLYSKGRIVSLEDDDIEDVITEEDIRHETFQLLNQSLVAGSVLKGKIIKAERRNRSAENPGLPTAIVQMDDDDYFKIKIPFTDFLPKDRLPEEIRGDSAADKLNYMDLLINMRTGANIRFIVKKLDESTGDVIASRTEAMKKNIISKWFDRDREGRFTLVTGDRVWGNVLYVDRSRICVEVFGIEQNLDISEVSWIRYSDLREAPIKYYKDKAGRINTGSYHAGDLIQLRIMGIKRTFRDKDGVYDENNIAGKRVRPVGIQVKLSAKECYENPDKKFFHDFALGEKVEAEITHVDENGIFCKLAGKRSGKIMFNTETPVIPPIGSRCLVRVTRMEEEGYRINCEIVQSYR